MFHVRNAGFAQGVLEVGPNSINPHGKVHGGALATLADTVGGCCACSKGGLCVTSSSTMEFLRPADGPRIFCTATPKKMGYHLSVIQVELTNVSGTFYQSPKLVCAYLLSCRTSVVPMTRTFLEEGVSDGSITVDSPQIAAEVVAVFTNLLLSPLVFSSTGPDFQRKVACVSTMLESIGLPLINDQVSAAFSAMGAVLYGEERT